jgi:hypothetical protein
VRASHTDGLHIAGRSCHPLRSAALGVVPVHLCPLCSKGRCLQCSRRYECQNACRGSGDPFCSCSYSPKLAERLSEKSRTRLRRSPARGRRGASRSISSSVYRPKLRLERCSYPFSDCFTRRILRSTHDPHRLSQPVLRITRHTAPFRGSAIVPTISFFLSRALTRRLPLYTRAFLKWTILAHSVERGQQGSLIHRSAWKSSSANFACTEFSKIRRLGGTAFLRMPRFGDRPQLPLKAFDVHL